MKTPIEGLQRTGQKNSVLTFFCALSGVDAGVRDARPVLDPKAQQGSTQDAVIGTKSRLIP